MNNFWNTQSNFTLISSITFEVFSQTLQNLQGSRRNAIQWCLQNYMVNGWELTSELTSKRINILKYSSKFTTNLTNNFRSTWAYVKLYSINPGENLQGSHTCTMGGTSSVLFQWRPAFSALWRRGNSVISVHHINNFEIIDQTSPNFQGSRCNGCEWCVQNYIKTVENWLRYQQKTLRRRCHNVGSVLCINNF